MANRWHRFPPALQAPRGPLRLAIYERDGNRCAIRLPGCTITPTELDHIISPQQGGAWYDPTNLRAACATCNRTRPKPKRHQTGTLPAARPSRRW